MRNTAQIDRRHRSPVRKHPQEERRLDEIAHDHEHDGKGRREQRHPTHCNGECPIADRNGLPHQGGPPASGNRRRPRYFVLNASPAAAAAAKMKPEFALFS